MNKKLNILKKFWAGKRVFITGHTGFKGSWLVIMLNLLGARVFGYSIKNSIKNYLFKIAKLIKIIDGHQVADIRDYDKLKKAIIKFKPDFLVHFAAQSLVKSSYIDPSKTYETNIMGTVNVLEALNKINHNIKAVLIATTDKVYDNNNKIIYFKENNRLAGNDPYSNSKACADLITNLYNFSFFKKRNFFVATARSGNVIGGGDTAKDRIIPDYFKILKKNKKLILRYPEAIRPWQHVIEPLYGYLLLLEKLYKKKIKLENNSWNFGPKKNNNESVVKMINILNNFFENKVHIISKKKIKREYESKVLMLDSSKAKKFLSWQGTMSLKQSVKLIFDWHKDYCEKIKPLDICKKQIINYLRNK